MDFRLYNIESHLKTILDLFQDAQFDDYESYIEMIDALEDDRQAILVDLALEIKNIKNLANQVAELEKKYKERRCRLENRQEVLRDYILAHYTEKIKTEEVSIYTMKTTAVKIEDESAIPEDYFRIKREVDKAKISIQIKSGNVVPGASMQDGVAIVIK